MNPTKWRNISISGSVSWCFYEPLPCSLGHARHEPSLPLGSVAGSISHKRGARMWTLWSPGAIWPPRWTPSGMPSVLSTCGMSTCSTYHLLSSTHSLNFRILLRSCLVSYTWSPGWPCHNPLEIETHFFRMIVRGFFFFSEQLKGPTNIWQIKSNMMIIQFLEVVWVVIFSSWVLAFLLPKHCFLPPSCPISLESWVSPHGFMLVYSWANRAGLFLGKCLSSHNLAPTVSRSHCGWTRQRSLQ